MVHQSIITGFYEVSTVSAVGRGGFGYGQEALAQDTTSWQEVDGRAAGLVEAAAQAVSNVVSVSVVEEEALVIPPYFCSRAGEQRQSCRFEMDIIFLPGKKS